MKVLIRLYANHKDRRGLGDSVQFAIILKHIKKYYPNWIIHTETTSGKEGCFLGLVDHTYNTEYSPCKPKEFEKVIDLLFPEPDEKTCQLCVLHQLPATKTLTAIVDHLKLQPIRDLFQYSIQIPEKTRIVVKSYLKTLPIKKGIVTLHYRANSWGSNKDIDEKDVIKICNTLIDNEYTPLILDWKGTLIADQKNIFCPTRDNSIWMGKPHGDAAVIAALIECSNLFVGVDSGPLHLAGATETPTIGYWKYHHPVHFYDLSKNVLHLTPTEHLKYIKTSQKSGVDEFFQKNYNHKWYCRNQGDNLINAIMEKLSIPQKIEIIKKPEPIIFFKKNNWWTIKVKN
jgi:hypothetical protein